MTTDHRKSLILLQSLQNAVNDLANSLALQLEANEKQAARIKELEDRLSPPEAAIHGEHGPGV